MKCVRVGVKPTPYDVLVSHGAVRHRAVRALLNGVSGAVVSSAPVMRRHADKLRGALSRAGFKTFGTILLPDGEAAKTVGQWRRTVESMASLGLDRTSVVIAFGGGSVGDSAGFASASYMRGIRVVHVPTTLLAMVDSSIGGKTALNIRGGKNLVGAFHQPHLVVADLDFLKTLPARELQSGAYEIIKCGFLKDPRLVALTARTGGLRRASDAERERAIARAIEIKARIVEADEKESGDRALLNLGHTLAHGLEAATSYRRFTHGEAVGYGLDFAADFSLELGLIDPVRRKEVVQATAALGRRPPLSRSYAARVARFVHSDKKRRGRSISEVLLAGVGRPVLKRFDAEELASRMSEWLRR